MSIDYDSNKVQQKLLFMQNNITKLDHLSGLAKSEFLSEWSSVKKKDRLNVINLYSANLHIFLHDHKAISSCNGYEFLSYYKKFQYTQTPIRGRD